MTDHTAERTREVAALIGDTRSIVDAGALDRATLDRIRARILQLAARAELWGEADYPGPAEGEQQNRYLVGQESPGGISLYLNVLRAGKKIPPHNHTTWACIAAVDGVEHNTLYDRLDHGSGPGKAEIRAVIRHLHFYGRPLETLDQRLTFDMENGTCKIMQMAVKTKI
jgi:predicted metal-dependent enzyme (double-stranded beta helix superfamily)